MFKKVATLQFKKIYASDNNKDYYWRDFVKQANDKLATDSNFVPKNFYEYNTDKFLYLTARAISGMEKWGPNGNYDAFPWEELKRSYPTFCGKGFYIEHKEDDEKDAKGIILDAQPDDDNEFINCICAISKEEYPDICEQILNGQLNQVSMSCLAAECECSECHNVATKEEELCEHMNPEHPHFCKGSSNLQNKPIYEINRNIVFTGLSGVAVPADKDAFIFDVKASKKSKTSIDKEYNKYLRAKKEYEYINKLLNNEDTRKYIESQLNKKAFQDIKGESWEEVLDNIQKAGYDFDEHYYDEPYHFIKALKDNKEYEIELFGYNNGSYEVTGISDTGKTYKDFGDFILNSSLKKKANNLYKVKVKTKNNFDSYLLNARNEEQAKKRYLRNNPNYKPEDIIVELAINEKDLQNSQNKLTVYLRKYNDNDIITSKEEIENFIKGTGTQLKVLHSGEYILINTNGEEFTIFNGYTLIKVNNELYVDTGGRSYNKIASLNKKASKFIIQDVESGMYFNNDDLVENQNEAQIFNTREEAENEIDRRMHKIIHKMQDKERKLEPINSEDYYDVVEITASLNKKADVEYMSDTIKEIPPIDFETEFMLAGKSKGCNSDINKDQLELGIKVEMEHTTNPVIAEKIACDHIKEIPNYYTLLAEMEASAKASYDAAKHVIDTETNEESPTKLASKQFFKVRKAAGHGFANVIKFKTDKDFYDKIKQLRKNKNIEVIYKIIDGVGLYLLYKGNEHLGTLNTHELTYYFDTDMSKQASKQFFKLNKANKNWFKIANINDDPEDRNDIDKYGLSELERKAIEDTVHTINITNPTSFITWIELEESIPQDIIDYDTLERKQQQIIDFIVNELKQEIEVY